jgi:Flp pilus assembly protein TadG
MTTVPHRRSPPAGLRAEDGQILVLTLIVALALLAILGLVADGGLLFARHRDLQSLADAAARAGAAQLDEAAYRASNGQTAQLNPAKAKAATARYLRASGFAGRASVSATTSQVTVGLAEAIRAPIFNIVGLGPIRLTVIALARPRTGITQQGP